jgi:antitoxin VapB
VPLSIRNRETERLARAVAQQSGESITTAIHRALEDRLLKLSGRRVAPDLVAELRLIGERCAALRDIDRRSAEEILGYDRAGVPNG